MSNHSIGITAMELFACNPYRVLGIAVDTSQTDITNTYKNIVSLAESGTIDQYTSPFDFDSLPPFTRTPDSLKAAYSKLASNGYRCFAYSDSQFTVPLNIDDVALNLRDITCYDCFLRCYMWLVINDRDMEENQLWIQLAQYIDNMVVSSPDQWAKLFDHRFPDEMIDEKLTVFKSFYNTFCEIILLPLKEMVRGSMKCRTAAEILKIKGINLEEEFEFIEIPQANAPKPGEQSPALKIALKDGDEYFDIATGKMVSFESDNSADVESNHFEEASAPITADEITGENDYPKRTEEKPAPRPQPDSTRLRAFADSDDEDTEDNSGFIKPKPITFKTFKNEDDEFEDELYDYDSVQEDDYDEPSSEPVAEKKTVSVAPPLKKRTPPQTEQKQQITTAPKLKKRKEHTTLLNDDIDEQQDSTDIDLTQDVDEEANLYTDALIQMLRANRSKNQLMKDVDTKHIFDNGDSLGSNTTTELTMEDINMKKYDSSLLASPYEVEESAPGISREEKFRDIKIDDMLNPTLGGKTQRTSFEPDAIEQFKKHKAEQKSSVKSLAKLAAILAVCCIAYIALKLLEII